MTQAYPLAWPGGLPRTAARSRRTSQFRTSLPGAVNNVQDEMRRFGADSGRKIESLVVSSNVTLMEQRPADPGVACYFVWDGIQSCIAVDRYTKPEENLQAIAKIIDAERTKLRHGGLNVVRASFRGYASLPPPPTSDALPKPWREVLGLKKEDSLESARKAYLALVKRAHPDHGGDPSAFNAIVEAFRMAQQELGT